MLFVVAILSAGVLNIWVRLCASDVLHKLLRVIPMLTSCMCGWLYWKPIQSIPTRFRNEHDRYIRFIYETALVDPPVRGTHTDPS